VTRALAPFFVAQIMILLLVVAQPRLVHLLDATGTRDRGAPGAPLSKEDLEKRFQDMARPNLPVGAPSFGTPPKLD
jgi:hypothetical protein